MATLELSELTEDSKWINLAAAASCFVLCLAVHHVACNLLFHRVNSYRQLPWQLRMEWDSRIVSSLHAALVTLLSLYSLLTEQPLWDGMVNCPTQLAGVTLSISAAYMMADAVSMPIYWRGTGLLVFWLHHGLAAACFFICARDGVLQFFALLRLTSEMSTPFLNVTWFSRLCRVSKASSLSLANSLCLTSTFLLCRIAVIPVYWYFFLRSATEFGFVQLASELGFSFFLWLGSSVTLDALNLHWARKIVSGGVRTAMLGLRERGQLRAAACS